MHNRLTFNPDRCLGCWNCELACSLVHSKSGQLETAIAEDPAPRRRLALAVGKNGIQALRCEQCLEPLCAFSCKSGAIHRDAVSGQVLLDEDRCVHCSMCLMVCPFGLRPDPEVGGVVRCDVCAGLEIPACVAACRTGALASQLEPDRRVRSEFKGHVVVVGSSAAGIAACEAAREHAPACSITLVTSDASDPYSRPLLAYLLAGKIEQTELGWRPEAFLTDVLKVQVLNSRRAVSLKSDHGPLLLDDGSELPFDRLVLATGARGTMVSIVGSDLPGIYPLRSIEDFQKIESLAAPGRPAVVLGGGNVGLQVCEALISRGMNVTVVVSSPYLLSQMVDAEAGRRVEELFIQHGARVRTGRDATEILGNGHVEGVRLDNGEILEADLVVAGKGIQPNVEWLQGTAIRIGRGIQVDLRGQTSVPGIYAAGDCAEMIDPLTGRPAVSGIWPVAYETGRAAGSTAVGVEYMAAGALRMNASRFFEVPIISIGEVRPERLEGARVQLLPSSGRNYRKLVYYQGRLAGALLFGDITGAGIFYRLYREAIPVDDAIAAEMEQQDARWVLGPLLASTGKEVVTGSSRYVEKERTDPCQEL